MDCFLSDGWHLPLITGIIIVLPSGVNLRKEGMENLHSAAIMAEAFMAITVALETMVIPAGINVNMELKGHLYICKNFSSTIGLKRESDIS
jgi:hypothetical protein